MARITRAQSALYLDDADLRRVSEELERMLKGIKSYRERREIVAPAGDVVIREAKRIAPEGKKKDRDYSIQRKFPPKRLRPDVKYTYNTPKLLGARKAGPGWGRVSGKYIIGNLRASITDIGLAKNLNTHRVVIGPLYTKRRSVLTTAAPKNANAWYAHMVYGSARAMRVKVFEKALTNKAAQVIAIIEKGVNRFFDSETAKNNYVK